MVLTSWLHYIPAPVLEKQMTKHFLVMTDLVTSLMLKSQSTNKYLEQLKYAFKDTSYVLWSTI